MHTESNSTYRRTRKNSMSILDVQKAAHQLAFYPMTFQAVRALLKFDLLALINNGMNSIQDLATQSKLSDYAVKLLLDVALANQIVTLKNNDYQLTKLGRYLLENDDIRINMDFMHDVCYQGAFYMDEALKTGKPAGLKVFGDWPTIYEGLGELPADAHKSWFDFDNYYSDLAFDEAVQIVLAKSPGMVYDIGGNTAKFDITLLNAGKNVNVTIFDLEPQLVKARTNIENAGFSSRAQFVTTNILSESTVLPQGADAVWMSQFLDCFSPAQIVGILGKVRAAINTDARVYIMEPFTDMQNDISAMTLLNISLYFTCMANGNSRMYKQSDMLEFVAQAGLKLVKDHQHISPYDYTVLECIKA